MQKIAGSSIGDRLNNLRRHIADVCANSQRDPNSVRLIAVSKFRSEAEVREAYASGQRDFGENYAQEALTKIVALSDLPGLRWHFIGHVQGNKAKLLGRHFEWVHSVDRASVATALARDPWSQDVMLQYNVAAEESKSGVNDLLELHNLFTFIDQTCPSLRVVGLMALPPPDEDPTPYFMLAGEALRDLPRGDGRHALNQLSMGTSGDYAKAIAAGSTCVRIGQDIFGPRKE